MSVKVGDSISASSIGRLSLYILHNDPWEVRSRITLRSTLPENEKEGARRALTDLQYAVMANIVGSDAYSQPTESLTQTAARVKAATKGDINSSGTERVFFATAHDRIYMAGRIEAVRSAATNQNPLISSAETCVVPFRKDYESVTDDTRSHYIFE